MARVSLSSSKPAVRVADEVWIAAALLHRENPDREDFLVSEIVERAEREGVYGKLRPGVYVHALQHCVANRPASPGRYRMLVATGKVRRRLYRLGDPYHPGREGAKLVPERDELPAAYRPLLDWYASEFSKGGREKGETDPILGLRGLGKEIWHGEEPDTYVSRLREAWE